MLARRLAVGAALVLALVGSHLWEKRSFRPGPPASGIVRPQLSPVSPGTPAIRLLLPGKRLVLVSRQQVLSLPPVAFGDQQGYRLADLVSPYLGKQKPVRVRVASSLRGNQAVLTWAQVGDPENSVLLVPARHRPTFKVVGAFPGLNNRGQWVRDLTDIEVQP